MESAAQVKTVGDLSPEELADYISHPQGDWEAAFLEASQLNPSVRVKISTEALRRENLYEDRGL